MNLGPSWQAVTTWFSSGENSAEQTHHSCPRNNRTSAPLPTSQIRAVSSTLAVASLVPSGLSRSWIEIVHVSTFTVMGETWTGDIDALAVRRQQLLL